MRKIFLTAVISILLTQVALADGTTHIPIICNPDVQVCPNSTASADPAEESLWESLLAYIWPSDTN
jgi:hypothetical protein